jgi:hypothetical protein
MSIEKSEKFVAVTTTYVEKMAAQSSRYGLAEQR